MRAALALVVPLLFGCQKLAGIGDVRLADDAGAKTDSSVVLPDVPEVDSGPAPYPWPTDAVKASPGCGSLARPGPLMARIESPEGAYCIDTTEVTQGQYAIFVAASAGKTIDTPPQCVGIDVMPPESWTDTDDAHPRHYVNWCMAFRYCKWAGKHLCRKRGGFPLEQDVADSEWTYACANGAEGRLYPYGSTYAAGTCHESYDKPAKVGSYPSCKGGSAPYDQLFDMSGSIAEWDDSCVFDDAGGWGCALNGAPISGSVPAAADFRCTNRDLRTHGEKLPGIGFRCCNDVL